MKASINSLNRASIAAVAASLALVSPLNVGATTIPSTYDAPSGKWIGDVIALTNAIHNLANGGEIILSRGEYDVSFLSGTPMYGSSAGKDYGVALLCSNGKSGVTIRGETGRPEDVVIDGKNCGIRVFALNGANSVFRDITVKGGVADALCAPYNYRNGGGVLFASAGTVSNCIFTACTASRGGGAVSAPYEALRGTVLDCVLYGNATSADGGAVRRCELVSGCTVVSNTAATGGGLAGCTTVTNCHVAYNYASSDGGGLYNCAVVQDSVVEGNSSRGASGGCYYECVFRDNADGNIGSSICLERCDISGGKVTCLTNVNCVFHDLRNSADDVWSVGNVHYPAGRTGLQARSAIDGFDLIRGCLIAGSDWDGSGSYYNSSLFYGSREGARIENCTIVDNSYRYLAQQFKTGQAFVNCAIVRNRNLGGSASDTSIHDSTRFCFSNCVWNVSGRLDYVTRDEAYQDGVNLVLGEGIDVKFVGNGAHPYAPRLRSPLRAYGMVLDWMADATDFVGNSRLRDGKVDVGCYECWIEPKSFVVSFQ